MSHDNVVRGLDEILSKGAEFITFEDGKSKVLLFIDWYQDLVGVREHYEKSLKPSYIRCPGKDVCPLCHANPGQYPALRIKFRVYDPTDMKIKFVSLAKSHIQKLNQDFNLDEVDPTKTFVTIYRTGKTAQDTAYSARSYKPNAEQGRPELALPNREEMELPDLTPQLTAHTPEEIQGFMNAMMANMQNGINSAAGTGYGAGYGTAATPPADAGSAAPAGGTAPGAPAGNTPPAGRRLPF